MRHQVEIHWHEDGDPSYQRTTMIDQWAADDGEHAAQEVAKVCHKNDFEEFTGDTSIAIISPADIAGVYNISVDMEPVYSAFRDRDLD